MLGKGFLGGLVVAGSLLAASPAVAQSPEIFGPYDGRIPFACALQNVGTGTDYPDPDADPFCVEFDKTNQNLTGFGIAEFLAQEPARVAAAAPKCFYFQRDHWTGSIVQGSEPELWHWDGDYFFDKARGIGGASVRNFRLGGVPMDATSYVPDAYKPFFAEGGGGGAVLEMKTITDPACAAMVDTPQEQAHVYGDSGLAPGCISPGGDLRGKRIGKVRLGMRRTEILTRLGPPQDSRRRVDHWCLVGKGELRVAYSKRDRAVILASSGRGHSLRGVARGDRARRAHRRLALELKLRRGGKRVFEAAPAKRRRAWVGIAGGRVRWVLLAKPGDVAEQKLIRATKDLR